MLKAKRAEILISKQLTQEVKKQTKLLQNTNFLFKLATEGVHYSILILQFTGFLETCFYE